MIYNILEDIKVVLNDILQDLFPWWMDPKLTPERRPLLCHRDIINSDLREMKIEKKRNGLDMVFL
jgi:hypothetical protein